MESGLSVLILKIYLKLGLSEQEPPDDFLIISKGVRTINILTSLVCLNFDLPNGSAKAIPRSAIDVHLLKD